jgi:hypothetical protein
VPQNRVLHLIMDLENCFGNYSDDCEDIFVCYSSFEL